MDLAARLIAWRFWRVLILDLPVSTSITTPHLHLPAWWNGVNLIASELAVLPVNVVQVTPKGKLLIKDHPVARLLDFESNDYVDSITFADALFRDAIVHGNAYAEVVRDKVTLEPIALFNIPFGGLTPLIVVDPENSVTGSRVVYQINAAQGDNSYLLAEDVIHLKGATQTNGLLGISLIDRALQSLGLGVATQNSALGYFVNGSRADGFLKYNGTLNPKQRAEYRREFYETHGGNNQHRVGFITGDWSYINTSYDPEKSQLLQQRQYSPQEVATLVESTRLSRSFLRTA